MEDKLILLVGASGSGKTTIAKELEEKGYNIIHSYTTREPREPNEWGHTFIKKEGFENSTQILQCKIGANIIAYKEIYGEHYFATKYMYQNKGISIYIIDPEGVEQVKENVKDAEVITIFLMADRQTRMIRLRSRFDSNYDVEEYINNSLKYKEDLRECVYDRINNDANIFKTCKCDYVIDANREIKEVLKDVVDIIG